ncbi:multiheme c-type cytochrome [Tautonia sociabilis]|uniref:Cytochrome c-552/4 domain-containing protein n=1 Tax=Tautonia sociabilis TaxID=2080755 RepID=A0A432MIN5_9BACT|nr:multiheme c-type cytochrome [Tautonia sociabilis]RUL87159.1 hypothetical protein TsocGM_13860 [Tautonia sociabilis]
MMLHAGDEAGRRGPWPFLWVVLLLAVILGGWAWMSLRDAPPPSPAPDPIAEARALLEAGQGDRARSVLESAGRQDAESWWLLSRAALQAGDSPAALDFRDRAIALGFDDDPMRVEPAPFVGASRCAGCHREIAAQQRQSHHARTYLAGEIAQAVPLPDGPIADPEHSDVVHQIRTEGNNLVVEATASGSRFRAVVDRLIGSGQHAITPVGVDDEGRRLEFRLSHYVGGLGWDLTSGHPELPDSPEGFLGRPLREGEFSRCLSCHTTNHEEVEAGSGPTLGDVGIGCERCHGPGGNHVLAAELGFPDLAIGRLKEATSDRVVALCGECHRPIEQGAPLLLAEEREIVRFQALTLPRSACSSKSPPSAKFDCVTCHDPHQDADGDPASYEAICRSCHSGPAPAGLGPVLLEEAQKACPVNPERGCIDCHMPKRPSTMRHTMFTDHFIRVRHDLDPEAGAPGAD